MHGMSEVMLVNVGLAVVNTVLAAAVGLIYYRNHREVRSPFTMALVLFAVFFVVHNALVVYHYFTMMPSDVVDGEGLMLLESSLQTVAIGSLAYATYR